MKNQSLIAKLNAANREVARLKDENEQLKEFKQQLIYLVDRLGHDAGSICKWGEIQPTAEEWANAVYDAANQNVEFGIAQEFYHLKNVLPLKTRIYRAIQLIFKKLNPAT